MNPEAAKKKLLAPAQLESLLRNGDVPYVLLSEARIRPGLFNDVAVAVVVARQCTIVQRAPGIPAAIWALYRCPGATPAP